MSRRYYRVSHTPIHRPCPHPDKPHAEPFEPVIVEGYANNAYHACKMAFKVMIKQGYITQPPKFNQDSEEFPNTTVEIIPEPEHEPVD